MSAHDDPAEACSEEKAVGFWEDTNGWRTVVVGDETREEWLVSQDMQPLDLSECV